MIYVRPFSISDIEAVHSLDQKSDFTLESVVGDLDDPNDNYNDFSWGFFVDKTLVGYCTIGYADCVCDIIENHPEHQKYRDTYILSDVFILPEHRSRGYGTQMVKRVIEERFKLESRLPVFLEVLDDSVKYFYKRIGFKEIRSKHGNYCMVFIP